MFSYASVPPPSRLYWYCQLLGWSLYFGFNLVLFSVFGRFSGELLLIVTAIVLPIAALTHALRYHIRANRWEQLPPLPLLGRLLVTNAALSVLSQLIIWALLIWVVRPSPDGQPHGWAQFLGYCLNVNFMLWMWAGFYFGWHFFHRYKQAEVDKWKLAAAVQEAEMRTLKAQINPHFMFNGLNNIRALVMEDPARARNMITHLSDLLRYSIQLEERLTYSLDVDPAALPVLIPPMTLQLLVENAIKHGIAPRPEGGSIQLTAQPDTATSQLHIVVRNTGRYQPQPGHEGVGLRNARERLALLFGKAATLTISNDLTAPDTVLAQLQLPVQVAVVA
jgi:two-component system LytT family sensor kinase